MSGKVSDNLGRSSGLTKAASTGAPTESASNPTVSTNPDSVGTRFINTTSGELFVCTDITAGENVWKGQLDTSVRHLNILAAEVFGWEVMMAHLAMTPLTI